ncbi:hypothetical protein ACFC0C_19180 [Streptomyces sp. NPDC056178]|uniref:hypothetical protein n=1 Tax=Streptomyces sp. NPDC056178 TaxID=3345735 RepID=UPI0035DF529B
MSADWSADAGGAVGEGAAAGEGAVAGIVGAGIPGGARVLSSRRATRCAPAVRRATSTVTVAPLSVTNSIGAVLAAPGKPVPSADEMSV